MGELVTKTKKLAISEQFWSLLEEAGELRGAKPALLFEMFLADVLGAIDKGRSSTPIPSEFIEARKALQAQSADALTEDIDLAKLARNNRNRGTGFDGVYESMGGYVIDARDPASGKVTRLRGRYPSPEVAAWARYQHYREHNLPYGKHEEMIAEVKQDFHLRQLGIQEPENASFAKAVAIWKLAIVGKILPDLPEEDRFWEGVAPMTAELVHAHYGTPTQTDQRREKAEAIATSKTKELATGKAKELALVDKAKRAEKVAAFNALMSKRKLPASRVAEAVKDADGDDRDGDDGGELDGGGGRSNEAE